MTANTNSTTLGAQMTASQPSRATHGGNQSKGGNYENPGGNSTGTMKTQMNANTTSGQPDNSELSHFMNNGGGPEPHQGSNPGAQSDPGPKEVGFYDRATSHMGGDDGVQATAERPSQMRMGGYEGTAPNAGQRGGQNTGTSGSQTTASGPGSMGTETRKPVGFASTFDEVGPTDTTSTSPETTGAPTMSYTGDAGSEGYQGVYQSRAAQRLVDMRTDRQKDTARMGGTYEEKPRAADKAGEVADAVKDKAGGFFSRARDRMEDFLTVDLNNDGVIGTGKAEGAQSYAGGSRAEPQAFETRERAPRMEPQAFETRETTPQENLQARPQAFEPFDLDRHGNGFESDSDSTMPRTADDRGAHDNSYGNLYGKKGAPDAAMPSGPNQGMKQTWDASHAEATQRELVDA